MHAIMQEIHSKGLPIKEHWVVVRCVALRVSWCLLGNPNYTQNLLGL